MQKEEFGFYVQALQGLTLPSKWTYIYQVCINFTWEREYSGHRETFVVFLEKTSTLELLFF